MKITYDLDLRNFEAWSGAVSTLDRVINEGKTEELEAILEDLYPDGLDETSLNDILWFDSEWIFESLGIRSEEQIQTELDDAEEELENLMERFKEEVEETVEFNNDSRTDEGMNKMDKEEIESLKNEIWEIDYKDEAEELEEKIKELKEELENI